MTSTRNKNTSQDYNLEQKLNKKVINERLYLHSASARPVNESIPTVGYIPSHMSNYALSNKEGSLKFFLDNEGGNSSLSNFGSNNYIEVKSKTLDSMNFNFKCKLFKVEAEGHEPEVIEGSLETLKRTEYVSIDYGFERGIKQENTIVVCNKMLYENEFKLVAFSEYRLIGLYKNNKYENE